MTDRNTLIYVDDALATLSEFKRVLKPGGVAHAIEGDWPMMVVEPVPTHDWAQMVDAVVASIDDALAKNTYLALAPQFVVTAVT